MRVRRLRPAEQLRQGNAAVMKKGQLPPGARDAEIVTDPRFAKLHTDPVSAAGGGHGAGALCAQRSLPTTPLCARNMWTSFMRPLDDAARPMPCAPPARVAASSARIPLPNLQRFQRPKREQQKLVIDERFKSMF